APWSGRNRFRSPLVELSFPDQASAQLEGEGTFSIALSGSDGSPDASLELAKGDDTPISAFEGPVQGATLGGCPVKEAMLVSSAPQSPLGGCQVPLATFEGVTDSGRKFTARAWQVGDQYLLVASGYHDAQPGNAAALEDTLKSIRLNCKAD
ncbi:MAG: hypothetical protein K6A65_03005, partial [Succinivibrionaceae bacterium]|nr:hypothetical protein [Succinivibrionaceae bacterium]